MHDVIEIIQLFGGRRQLARALGVGVSALSNWIKAEKIPDHQKFKILRLAIAHNKTLPEWFFAIENEGSRGEAA